jgi:propionyl-CoA carboxylase alpha chain
MFNKILIANRGEIACRIIHTARKMGIKTVAVFSEADRRSLHVGLADEAVCLGPPPSKESYLVIDKIIAACKRTGAQAVHPGYGFLSENMEFAKQLEEAGIVFIGPKHASIAAMGDKIASKKLALIAKVNTIPGFNEAIETPEQAIQVAAGIGYPVMIKASAGGGGKGLRVAFSDQEVSEGFCSCHNEAQNAFGDDRVFIEKYIEQPRHIEIQLLGDAHGNCVYLQERECSIQRRHQKVLEEAPSPLLDEATRKAMGEQAVALALAVQYQSAGTVEFIVDKDKHFYFLEMNTRLQVEHPVTEMITGIDLVEWMIRVAAGEKLPFAQKDIQLNGWALECRINAEDPFRNFLPSVGRLTRYIPPPETSGVRVDTGVREGGEISVYYDSLIAKLITHGATRGQAVTKMRDALNAFVISGASSNIAFLAALMKHPRFQTGDFDTGFIAEEFPMGFSSENLLHSDPLLLAAVAAFARSRYIMRAVQTSGRLAGHDRKVGNEWVVMQGEKSFALTLLPIDGGYAVSHEGQTHELKSTWRLGEHLFRGSWNSEPVCLQVERMGIRYRIVHWGTQVDMMVMTANAARMLALMPHKPKADLSKFLLSPMPGLLTEMPLLPGQEIKAGEKLAVIEAMKMENILKAEHDCTVAEVMAEQGDSLAVDQPIARFM